MNTTLRNTSRAKAMAGLIEDAAAAWAKIARDPKVKKDPALAQCYRDDAKDLLYVADLIRKNEFAGAANVARRLDNIVREQIPDKAWDWLMRFIEE